MKKQNGSNPLVGAVVMDLLCLALTFVARNSVNYYFDSSFQILVDGATILFAVGLVISVVWMVLVHNQQPQPKIVNQCPHCGAKVSMYSDVCWKCHKPLKEGAEENASQQSAAEARTTRQSTSEAQKTIIDSANVLEPDKMNVEIADEGQLFEVYFKGLTDSKKTIKVIQVVREVVGLSLADGKQFVENPPSVLKVTTSMDEAKEIKGLLESVGAIVEIKEKM